MMFELSFKESYGTATVATLSYPYLWVLTLLLFRQYLTTLKYADTLVLALCRVPRFVGVPKELMRSTYCG